MMPDCLFQHHRVSALVHLTGHLAYTDRLSEIVGTKLYISSYWQNDGRTSCRRHLGVTTGLRDLAYLHTRMLQLQTR